MSQGRNVLRSPCLSMSLFVNLPISQCAGLAVSRFLSLPDSGSLSLPVFQSLGCSICHYADDVFMLLAITNRESFILKDGDMLQCVRSHGLGRQDT